MEATSRVKFHGKVSPHFLLLNERRGHRSGLWAHLLHRPSCHFLLLVPSNADRDDQGSKPGPDADADYDALSLSLPVRLSGLLCFDLGLE